MSNPATARKLQAKILAYQTELTPVGYPPQLRKQVGTYARARRGDGKTWSAIAQEIGVSRTALASWTKETVTPASSSLIPVLITEEPSPITVASLSILSPHGFRLEGLSLEQATLLLGVLR